MGSASPTAGDMTVWKCDTCGREGESRRITGLTDRAKIVMSLWREYLASCGQLPDPTILLCYVMRVQGVGERAIRHLVMSAGRSADTLGEHAVTSNGEMDLSEAGIVALAKAEADATNCTYVGTEHILLAVVHNFAMNGIDAPYEVVKAAVMREISGK